MVTRRLLAATALAAAVAPVVPPSLAAQRVDSVAVGMRVRIVPLDEAPFTRITGTLDRLSGDTIYVRTGDGVQWIPAMQIGALAVPNPAPTAGRRFGGGAWRGALVGVAVASTVVLLANRLDLGGSRTSCEPFCLTDRGVALLLAPHVIGVSTLVGGWIGAQTGTGEWTRVPLPVRVVGAR
jgi:hypothetical protein